MTFKSYLFKLGLFEYFNSLPIVKLYAKHELKFSTKFLKCYILFLYDFPLTHKFLEKKLK